jgi:hypothetical protein
MTSLKQLLLQETNPFDPTTHKIFNFWDEPYQQIPIVETIHQSVITQVETILDRITQDHITRSIIVAGDSGSGKSIVLGRLRDQLNAKAFFVYVGHWEENDYVWRHTLRCTVDSLLQVPAHQSESQLLLWLKGLPIFHEKGWQTWLLGERRSFIQTMRAAYPVGIYNPSEFFGVLYDLTNPELYSIASDWLKGDSLDDEDLKRIKVRNLIESERAAREIIGNFGKISRATYPIVLCFDNLDNVPQLADGSLDLQPLFDINTTIHGQNLKNFLVVISLVTNNWKRALEHIQNADRASIYKQFVLRAIDLEQAEQLWAVRLAPLHKQVNPKPTSPIAPLTRKHLEEAFPGGKANPRSVLQLGYRLIERERLLKLPPLPSVPPAIAPVASPDTPGAQTTTPLQPLPSLPPVFPTSPVSPSPHCPVATPARLNAAFKSLWRNELKQTQQQISRFRQFSSIELVAMLRNTLTALGIRITKPRLLTGQARDVSFAYAQPKTQQNIGVIWTEDSNMTSFFYVMRSAQTITERGSCDALYLIRAESTGRSSNQGHRLYRQLFEAEPNRHLIPDMNSLCDFVTYDRLFRAAKTQDLLLLDQELDLNQLEFLIQDTAVFQNCALLGALGILQKPVSSGANSFESAVANLRSFILEFMMHHQLASQGTIIKHTQSQFMGTTEAQILELIQEFCRVNRFRILDLSQPVSEQIVCLIPS